MHICFFFFGGGVRIEGFLFPCLPIIIWVINGLKKKLLTNFSIHSKIVNTLISFVSGTNHSCREDFQFKALGNGRLLNFKFVMSNITNVISTKFGLEFKFVTKNVTNLNILNAGLIVVSGLHLARAGSRYHRLHLARAGSRYRLVIFLPSGILSWWHIEGYRERFCRHTGPTVILCELGKICTDL